MKDRQGIVTKFCLTGMDVGKADERWVPYKYRDATWLDNGGWILVDIYTELQG
jgi:hypothetical protein